MDEFDILLDPLTDEVADRLIERYKKGLQPLLGFNSKMEGVIARVHSNGQRTIVAVQADGRIRTETWVGDVMVSCTFSGKPR